ncbi:MAG: FAD-dependent oxidoreductase [Ferruginibacter sp.]|nr:FAD-dependent oxidoreductase [Rhodoferax sp.]
MRSALLPNRCAVIGAGLAGAAVAASLARRGWQVQVLDAASHAAAGASSLPAGLLAPLVSKDDNIVSRLCRSGVAATLQQAHMLLQEDADWQPSGVQEQRIDQTPPTPLWHAHAGWIQPARLVQAWLQHPHIQWQGNAHVAGIASTPEGWRVLDAHGHTLVEAPMLVIAAGLASAAWVRAASGVHLPLQAIRGQVTLGERNAAALAAFPVFPVNGHGCFIPNIPNISGLAGRRWMLGASFERDNINTLTKAADNQANLERLQVLLPATAAALQAQFALGNVSAWAGVRCAARDRLPIVGCIAPGLWISTAMGSRGLTFAHLCAELLAAQLHGEPGDLEPKLAAALDVRRFVPKAVSGARGSKPRSPA